MAEPYTDNNGTTFYNQNHCRSFALQLSTGLNKLVDEVCSEVILINKTGEDINIFDNNYFEVENRLLLQDGESFIIRGVTNAMQISAGMPSLSSTGLLYYRTQWYSNLPQR